MTKRNRGNPYRHGDSNPGTNPARGHPVRAVCAWCWRSLAGRKPGAKFCSDSCRAYHWRAAKTYGPSFFRERPTRTALNGNQRGGRQLSYAKAVRALTEWIEVTQPANPSPELTAEVVLKPCLPEKQRRSA